jgi:hypothetical protein
MSHETNEQPAGQPADLKPGQLFGRYTLVGPVDGGWHVVCSCGRDVIVRQLIDGPGTEDFQRCSGCKNKARTRKLLGKPYFTPSRREKVAQWVEKMRDGKSVAFDLRIISRMTGTNMKEWAEMDDQKRLWLLEEILKDNPAEIRRRDGGNGTG